VRFVSQRGVGLTRHRSKRLTPPWAEADGGFGSFAGEAIHQQSLRAFADARVVRRSDGRRLTSRWLSALAAGGVIGAWCLFLVPEGELNGAAAPRFAQGQNEESGDGALQHLEGVMRFRADSFKRFHAARARLTSSDASRAKVVRPAQSRARTKSRGANQEPPSARTEGSTRYVSAFNGVMPPRGMKRTPK